MMFPCCSWHWNIYFVITLTCMIFALVKISAYDIPRTCSADYVYYAKRHTCYKFTEYHQMAWQEAREYCQDDGGDLPLVPDDSTKTFIVQMSSGYNSWIGLKEIDNNQTYRWVDGNFAYYFDWKPGNPDNDDHRGNDCVEILNGEWWRVPGYFNDVPCSYQRNTLCEKAPRVYPECLSGYASYHENSKCVKIVQNGTLDWNEARGVCQKDGGDLVVIKDKAYNSFIQSFLQVDKTYWIGLYSSPGSNTFQWVDGTPLDSGTYNQMPAGQPDVAMTGIIAGYIESNDSLNGWKDTLVDAPMSYVCEQDYYVPLGCPGSEWVFNKTHRKCYKIQHEAQTHQDSHAGCQLAGDHLADVTDVQIIPYLQGLIMGNSTPYWVGEQENPNGGCFGGYVQTGEQESIMEHCDKLYPSICERPAVITGPVMICPSGYTTYVTTTSDWPITCVMADNTRRVTWYNATRQCWSVGGQLYDMSKSEDTTLFMKQHLLFHGNWYWFNSDCKAYSIGQGRQQQDCVDDQNYVMCQQWGRIETIANLTDIVNTLLEVVDDVHSDQSIFLTDLCQLWGMYNAPEWIQTSHKAFVFTNTSWTDSFMKDQMTECAMYTGETGCCAQITLNKPTSFKNEPTLRLRIPLKQFVSCVCPEKEIIAKDPTPLTQDAVDFLRNVTAPQSGNTPHDRLCPCRCDSVDINYNPSPVELDLIISRIQKELEIEIPRLSSRRAKKESAQDERTSSQAIGYIGLVFCGMPLFLIAVVDISAIFSKGTVRPYNTADK